MRIKVSGLEWGRQMTAGPSPAQVWVSVGRGRHVAREGRHRRGQDGSRCWGGHRLQQLAAGYRCCAGQEWRVIACQG